MVWIVLILALVVSLGPTHEAIAQENGVVEGAVINGTAGAAPAADVEVVLHILQNRAKIGERRVLTDGSGRFRVDGLATGQSLLYFPIVEYAGVAYFPDRPIVLEGAEPVRTEIAVFESTPTPDAISFERLNMLIMGVTPSALTIMEMGAVTNGADRTFAADPTVTGSARTLRFLIPPGAINVTPQAGLPADTLESMADGFASTDPVRPGRREIAFSYDLPYSASSLDLTRSFAFPVGTFTLYVPNDLGAVVPDAIVLAGLADLGGRQYRQYAVERVVPGAVVRVRLMGLPAPLVAKPRDLGLIVVGVAGAALLVCLVLGLRRRRTDAQRPVVAPSPETVVPTPAVSPERASLVRAVAELDERFAAGGIDEAAYRAERADRKARLLALTQSPVAAA